MIQDLQVKLNPYSHGKNSIQEQEDIFHQQILLKIWGRM
jgi:hypothetical protein